MAGNRITVCSFWPVHRWHGLVVYSAYWALTAGVSRAGTCYLRAPARWPKPSPGRSRRSSSTPSARSSSSCLRWAASDPSRPPGLTCPHLANGPCRGVSVTMVTGTEQRNTRRYRARLRRDGAVAAFGASGSGELTHFCSLSPVISAHSALYYSRLLFWIREHSTLYKNGAVWFVYGALYSSVWEWHVMPRTPHAR